MTWVIFGKSTKSENLRIKHGVEACKASATGWCLTTLFVEITVNWSNAHALSSSMRAKTHPMGKASTLTRAWAAQLLALILLFCCRIDMARNMNMSGAML